MGVADAECIDDGPPETGERDIKQFQFARYPRVISYRMQSDTAFPDGSIRSFLHSMNFTALIDIEYLTIPHNGLEFVLLLLQDVEVKWMQLIASAKLHLGKIVNYPR